MARKIEPPFSGWPLAEEIAHRAVSIRLLRASRARLLDAMPELAAIGLEATAFRPDAADGAQMSGWGGALARVFARLINAMLDDVSGEAPRITEITGRINERQRREWRMIVRARYGVDVYRAEPWLRSAMQAFEVRNTDLIRSIPQTALEQSRGLFHDAFTRGATQRELRGVVQERFGVARARADLIARDQVGKLDGELTELRQRDLGVKSFIWRTSGDERVRPEHRALNGKTFEWAKPPAIGRPGQPIRCRCRAEAILPDIEEILNGG